MSPVGSPGSSSELAAARERVATAGRALAAEGLTPGTAGNLSERVGDRVLITPTGAHLETLQADAVAIVDLDGAVVDGGPAPSSELGLHLAVYTRDWVTGVVHTHAPMATALSCVLDELPCVHYGMLALGGSVRVAPYRTFGTPELAAAVLEALDGRVAALMANHGTVTCAHTLEAAVQNTRLLEWACTVYWRAAQIGTPRVLSAAELQAVADQVIALNYGAPASAPAR